LKPTGEGSNQRPEESDLPPGAPPRADTFDRQADMRCAVNRHAQDASRGGGGFHRRTSSHRWRI